MSTLLRQILFPLLFKKTILTTLGLFLLLTQPLTSWMSDYSIAFVSPAWAEPTQPVSRNSLIRRPTPPDVKSTKDKNTFPSSSALEEAAVSSQPEKMTDSNEDITHTSEFINLQNTNPQENKTSPQKDHDAEKVARPAPEKDQDTFPIPTRFESDPRITNRANLPIFSTPLASSPVNATPSRNLAGALSPSSAFTKQGNQPVVPLSRKLTQIPGINKINSRQPVPPSPRTSPPASKPAPTPSPTPAPSPAPASAATLTWAAANDPDLAGYKVYRKTSPGDQYMTPIATIRGTTTTFQSTNLKIGTTYYFVVTAFDIIGNESSFSNEVSQSIF